MKLTIKQLESGYWHVRGTGPCNWAQFLLWPRDIETARRAAFPEASDAFCAALISAPEPTTGGTK